ncbi:hypothetical protein VIBHAR_01771 [Vibrio campbellii ATCC BAA-1116]|uniref:Uncharacterized protein n=1 Tax=Vibrio campbellii (strain ATCC BAA-1116) TaxID=2902295 RepID=A7MZ14_VIBC1|nr:hypothetical protein VIBHAR_01771 [Vibrio campbellii ATCC BAA-1116]
MRLSVRKLLMTTLAIKDSVHVWEEQNDLHNERTI